MHEKLSDIELLKRLRSFSGLQQFMLDKEEKVERDNIIDEIKRRNIKVEGINSIVKAVDGFQCTSDDMHPYECNGRGKCIHCDKVEDEEHNTKTCELCQ
jgi:hypothetical protein